MKNEIAREVAKFVTRAKASFLLGIPQEELLRISRETGLGHLERAGSEEETFFTYEELQRICVLVTCPMQGDGKNAGKECF